jgi:inosose dehydratase
MTIGIQPTGWTNDNFPENGNDYPYQVILDQTKEADFDRQCLALFAQATFG